MTTGSTASDSGIARARTPGCFFRFVPKNRWYVRYFLKKYFANHAAKMAVYHANLKYLPTESTANDDGIAELLADVRIIYQ